jgi:hypothetical protein
MAATTRRREDNFIMPSAPVFRLARAVVFAAVCVTLATTGHVMISHAPVPPVAVGAGLAVLIAVATALGGAERSLATILAGLIGGQFMLHALFAAAQQGQNVPHGHPAPSAASGGTAMVLAHVAAAAISAWWLRRGERAVWGLARRVAAAAVRPARALLSAPAPLSPPPRLHGGATPALEPLRAVLRHAVVRRGPPSPSTALA